MSKLSQWVDPKIVGGAILGASIAFTGYSVADTNRGYFGSIFTPKESTLAKDAESVVAASIKQDAAECAAGDKPGTIGHAVKNAYQIHTEMASIPVDVESLFQASGTCFDGVGDIFDLSFAIPSLASIVSAAQSALVKFAQKKVCSAVDKVSGLVTSPINQALGKVGGIGAFTDINGFANDIVGNGLGQLDPDLGREYGPATPGGTYTVNTFDAAQTNFNSAPQARIAPSTPTTQAPTRSAPAPTGVDRLKGLFN